MKIVFTGAEFYLSTYLNFLKVPMALFMIFIALDLIIRVVDANDTYDTAKAEAERKGAFIVKHPFISLTVSALSSLYMFLVWV